MDSGIMHNNPLFSIIVVSYNAEQTIYSTIASVLSQSYVDYEIIIKDGKSSDNTIANVPANDKIKIFVEEDKGIYDAMNQAVKYACGDYLLFLNCGDSLAAQDVLERVKEYIYQLKKRVKIVYGDFICNNIRYASPKVYNKRIAFYQVLCHQTIFFEKRLFEKVGGYDCKYLLASDYEIILRILNLEEGVFGHISYPVCIYERGGISEQKKKETFEEQTEARKCNYNAETYRKFALLEIISLRRLRKRLNGDWMPYWLRNGLRKIINKFK